MNHKKQPFCVNKSTIQWNVDRGNIPSTLDWNLEIAMLQEELDELKLATTDVDRLDALCDLKFVLTGSMGKMGLTAEQVTEADQVVLDCNLSKSGHKDSDGKVTKPDNFSGPEPQLQLILNQRDM